VRDRGPSDCARHWLRQYLASLRMTGRITAGSSLAFCALRNDKRFGGDARWPLGAVILSGPGVREAKAGAVEDPFQVAVCESRQGILTMARGTGELPEAAGGGKGVRDPSTSRAIGFAMSRFAQDDISRR